MSILGVSNLSTSYEDVQNLSGSLKAHSNISNNQKDS
jgi:hypothetical protein